LIKKMRLILSPVVLLLQRAHHCRTQTAAISCTT
jgi:hypothetical protein